MFRNVSFTDKLPEDALYSNFDFNELLEIKNAIDLRLKSLENKIKNTKHSINFEKTSFNVQLTLLGSMEG